MRTFLFCAVFLASPVLAGLTDAQKAELLKLTDGAAEELVIGNGLDDLDKKVRATYSGPKVQNDQGCTLRANSSWAASDVSKVIFILHVDSPPRGAQWGQSDLVIQVDGKRLGLLSLSNGGYFSIRGVPEVRSVQMTLEQALQILAAQKVHMTIGSYEATWSEVHKIPLMVVLTRWLAHGGDASGHPELVKRLLRPSAGTMYAEVVKKFGEPKAKDLVTGWADWESFQARFTSGRVVETRPQPIK